jgi:hypothetical protein
VPPPCPTLSVLFYNTGYKEIITITGADTNHYSAFREELHLRKKLNGN